MFTAVFAVPAPGHGLFAASIATTTIAITSAAYASASMRCSSMFRPFFAQKANTASVGRNRKGRVHARPLPVSARSEFARRRTLRPGDGGGRLWRRDQPICSGRQCDHRYS
jgi:hypothetical protein